MTVGDDLCDRGVLASCRTASTARLAPASRQLRSSGGQHSLDDQSGLAVTVDLGDGERHRHVVAAGRTAAGFLIGACLTTLLLTKLGDPRWARGSADGTGSIGLPVGDRWLPVTFAVSAFTAAHPRAARQPVREGAAIDQFPGHLGLPSPVMDLVAGGLAPGALARPPGWLYGGIGYECWAGRPSLPGLA
jgi:hypothetical protein